ncbi:MAG: sensor histidine kinase [Alphaproteobacteria bacterium]
MASAPSDPRPILGRVDANGRLIAADPELERLQVEAGSSLGATLALPQLAAVVRIAQRLRIPISRRVLAAGADQDVDMWVRAVPEDGEVAIAIEQWSSRPAAPPRLTAIASVEREHLGEVPLTWSVDEQLRIVALSPGLAEQLSIDPAEAAGQPLTKFLKLEENEDGEMPLLAALASRKSFEMQRAQVRSGEQQLTLSGDVVLGAGDSFAGLEGSASAMGDTKGEAALVDPSLHSALQVPLDSIVRSAEDMAGQAERRESDEYAAYAADIATAARHLLSVIRSLGEQAQLKGDRPVDLCELTREAVGLVEPEAGDREIAIAVQRAGEIFARAEPRSVIQILVNLLGNAVRHTREQTAVTVSFEKGDGSVLVHVADEGPGIDPDDHQRIFEPFEQANGGDRGGTGLGLAISRRLARGLGGDIRLQSRPGEGARFTLALPAA